MSERKDVTYEIIGLIPSLSLAQLEQTLKYIAELLKEPKEDKKSEK